MERINKMLYSDQAIEDIRQFLVKGVPPADAPASFYRRARNFTMDPTKSKLLVKNGGQEVIDSSQIIPTLQKLYDDPVVGMGRGVDRFYKLVIERYAGIKRAHVAEFIRSQPLHQIQQPIRHQVNKPITATYPNQIIAIDLIDVSMFEKSNNGFNWILDCVDIFSGYCWLGKLKTKTAVNVRNEFDRIVPVFPTHILCDNGGEFKGEFAQWAEDNGIKIRTTASYSPQSNGVVEAKNKAVRKLMRAHFIRGNNRRWTNVLDTIADNLNQTFNRRKRGKPADLYDPEVLSQEDMDRKTGRVNRTRVLPDTLLTEEQRRERTLAAEKERNETLQRQFEENAMHVGDRVRIKMTALYSEARKLQKAGRGKEMIITYSPDVYRVILAVKPLSAAKFEYYLVRERDNAHPNRSFFLSDLVHAGEGDLPAHITTERAMALNGTKFIADYDNIAE